MPIVTPPAIYVAPAPVVERRAGCDRIAPGIARGADASPGDVRPKRLTELPPANLVLTLYRNIGGCDAPVIVRYGLGARSPGR